MNLLGHIVAEYVANLAAALTVAAAAWLARRRRDRGDGPGRGAATYLLAWRRTPALTEPSGATQTCPYGDPKLTITVDTWVSDHYGDPHAEVQSHHPAA
ncbi:hypothetical protein ACIBQ5_37590 [Streptomyces massasporeus]|uniref:hypothetical protein n=1 Tax=Streptomyces massasporeus TaxID=67324 RepID=UPI0037A6A3D1